MKIILQIGVRFNPNIFHLLFSTVVYSRSRMQLVYPLPLASPLPAPYNISGFGARVSGFGRLAAVAPPEH